MHVCMYIYYNVHLYFNAHKHKKIEIEYYSFLLKP